MIDRGLYCTVACEDLQRLEIKRVAYSLVCSGVTCTVQQGGMACTRVSRLDNVNFEAFRSVAILKRSKVGQRSSSAEFCVCVLK